MFDWKKNSITWYVDGKEVYRATENIPLTVRYQDSEGNQLAEPSILSGKIGLPYDSEPKEIPGWYVVETPENASGIFTEDPQEVVYVDELKNPDSKGNNNSSNHLPKTGEQIRGQMIMTTTGAIIIALTFVIVKKRKKDRQ